MPQLDIYLLMTFVWSSLIFFIILYLLNIVYVNSNLFIILNLRYLKNFIDKIFMVYCIKNHNQLKQGKVLNNFFILNQKKLFNIKDLLVKKNFINISFLKYNMNLNINLKNKKVNQFIKLNIEANRID